ncbi:MAG TPA: urate hydroxylase PuuD, partial [Gemmatimonadaceae bacterium]
KPVGKIWLLHSGGFYYVEKTLLEGERLPHGVHWFKWQAYTTWLSGVALLIVVYYLGGRAVMSDGSLSHSQAALIGAGAILGGWAWYEITQRFIAPRAPALAAILFFPAFIVLAIVLTQVLNGRAAFLHVGALMGTIMAGNVFWTIVPSQRELVKSVESGGGGLSEVSARAKRVSVHNNYFTFPVIALMVSNHFSAVYASSDNWVLLLVILAGGALIRHILNIRWTFAAWKLALAGAIAGTLIFLWAGMNIGAPSAAALPQTAGPVSFEDARHIIDRRCAVCHSERPTDLTFGPAPAGVMFDTQAQIEARAARIRERAFVTRTMPPANKTHITDDERAMLGRWAEAASR